MTAGALNPTAAVTKPERRGEAVAGCGGGDTDDRGGHEAQRTDLETLALDGTHPGGRRRCWTSSPSPMGSCRPGAPSRVNDRQDKRLYDRASASAISGAGFGEELSWMLSGSRKTSTPAPSGRRTIGVCGTWWATKCCSQRRSSAWLGTRSERWSRPVRYSSKADPSRASGQPRPIECVSPGWVMKAPRNRGRSKCRPIRKPSTSM